MNKLQYYLDSIRALNNEDLIRFLVWCSRYGSIPLGIITKGTIGDEECFEFAVNQAKKSIEYGYIIHAR